MFGKLKPNVSEDEVKELVKKFYGFDVIEIQELDGYSDCNFYCKVNDNNQIFEVNLKITNHLDTEINDLIESLNDLSFYLYENGIKVPIPLMNLNGNYLERIHLMYHPNQKNTIRLFTFLPGTLLQKINFTPKSLFNFGVNIGKFSLVIRNYENCVIKNKKFLWDLENALDIKKYIDYIPNNRKELVLRIIDEFQLKVLDNKDRFAHSIIHDDLNDNNLLVSKSSANEDEYYISSFLDLGDVNYSLTIFDIAIFCAYCMLNLNEKSVETLEIPTYILNGYNSIDKISKEEFDIIPISIKTRICQSLVLGAFFHNTDPDNLYLLETSRNGWFLLEELENVSEEELVERWSKI